VKSDPSVRAVHRGPPASSVEVKRSTGSDMGPNIGDRVEDPMTVSSGFYMERLVEIA
jgi:hypothetical protein